MLNPALYDRLVRKFGKVQLVQENVPAEIEMCRGVSLHEWRIGEGGSGEQYRVDCPFCGDHKQHLYISYLSFSTPLYKGERLGKCGLLAKCFRRNCLSSYENRQILREALLLQKDIVETAVVDDNSALLPAYDVSPQITISGFQSWYPEYQPIETCQDQEILAYLAGRGISVETASKYRVGYGRVESKRPGKFLADGAPFLMLPIIEPDGCRGIQLRVLPQHQGTVPKYLFHPACKRNYMLYNRARAALFKLGVLVEGAFDVMKVGPCGLAMFGHTPSKIQKAHLEHDFGSGGLIWLPDIDVKRTPEGKVELDPAAIARKQCAVWFEQQAFPWGAHVVYLPKKDAGEMTTEELWLTILSQIKNSVMLTYIQEHILPEVLP